ncbi:MFS transporter [Megasphaera vaginalis (ex Bordigoni et al. 2020)]|uniref:MFS transporter n=1 Tax=Megasphaera vaginalis (ex Bordigoni et al. 2020) TaxID=2045301 RepID=UPI000C7C1E81|nr:MFS transporter [Megasphaera vaginalis (ex Bordigoni et al. 2020)]
MSSQKVSLRLSPKQLLTIFFLGLGYTVVYATPFIQYVFYDSLVSALGCTQQQLGYLITIFGIGNILAAFGGLLSDRFNTKTIYMIGIGAICILNILFAFNMNYTFALFTWAGFAFAGLFLYFPAHIKLSRLVGNEEQQGTIFGFVEAFCGVGNVIVNFIALYFFTQFATDAYGINGLRAAIICYAVIGIITLICLYFLIPKPVIEKEEVSDSEIVDEKMGFSGWIDILKDPRTWMSGIAVFATYTMYCTLSYYTPYFSKVLGASVVFTGSVAIMRTYGTRFIGAPLGGWLGDKFHSLSSVIGLSLGGAILCVLIFKFLPKHTDPTILIALTIFLGILTYMARGSMFAVPSELKIPRKYAGSTSGIVCCLGYCPDLFIFVLYGYWLDTYGNQGFDYIFLFAAIVMAIGVINSIAITLYKKRHSHI